MVDDSNLSKGVIVRFVVVYLALIAIMEIFLGLRFFQNYLDLNGIYSDTTAFLSAKLLSFLGIKATSTAAILDLPGRSLRISFGCNGLEAVVIYGCAVIAYPSNWLYRLKGLLYGFVVLLLLNLLRIVGLGFTVVKMPQWFDYVHYYIAQGLMIVIALGLFMVWLKGTRHG